MSSNRYIPEIDGIRGALSLIVVTAHVFPGPLTVLAVGCMEMFFCISGLLITRIVIANADTPGFFLTYLYRRALRIWPLYYVVYAACLLTHMSLNYVGVVEFEPGAGVIKSLFFVQNVEHYWGEKAASSTLGYDLLFEHSWSVALEEQFYLLLPALYFMFRRMFGSKYTWPFVALLLSLPLVSLLSRMYGLHWWTLLGRLDGFMLGAMLAVMESLGAHRTETWRRLVEVGLFCSSLIVIAVAVAKYHAPAAAWTRDSPLLTFNSGLLYSATLSASALGLLLCHIRPPLLVVLRKGPLAYLGKISYSTYLWHFPIAMVMPYAMREYYGAGQLASFFVVMPTVLGISALSHKYIETSFMKLKKGLPYPTRASAGDVARVPS